MATIKKGTYRFNDILTDPAAVISPLPTTGQQNIGFYVDVEFEATENDIAEMQGLAEYLQLTSPVPQETGIYKLRVNCSAFYSITENSLYYMVGLVECEPYSEFFTYFIYFASSNGRFSVYYDKWKEEQYQIVNIKEDTEVDDTFATWFAENTRMLIKAGTYRWNDVISQFFFDYSIVNLPCTVDVNLSSSDVERANQLLVEFGYAPIEVQDYFVVYDFSQWQCYYNENVGYSLINLMDVDILSTIPSNDYLSSLGTVLTSGSEFYRSDRTPQIDLFSVFNVTEDTLFIDVDEPFVTWFNNNTKEVKAISGKRKFKNTLTQSIPQLNVAVNFTFELTNANFEAGEVYTETITANGLIQEPYFEGREDIGALWYNFGGENFGDFQGIYLWESKGWKVHYLGQTREQMSEALISAMPDIDETTLNYYLDEMYKCYGEGIKTVDFGTEPQYIPVDAWDWIMENTEPIGNTKIFTKLNICEIAYSIAGKCFRRLSTVAKLSAPIISLDGSLLTITDTSGKATQWNVYKDGGILMGCQAEPTIDLSSRITESGTYSITVTAFADGYEESEPSNAVEYVVEDANFLTFSSPNTFTLGVVDNKKYWDGTLEYSTDKSTWNTWDGTTALSADSGKLYLRGTGNTYISGPNYSSTKGFWKLTGSDISCFGNIENLLDYSTVANGGHPTMERCCYKYLFRDCTSLITPPELRATNLPKQAYSSMFNGCTNLITAPALPATSLKDNCYDRMFYGCVSLTSLPALPATTLATYCYYLMFNKCTKLKLSTVKTGEYQTEYRIPMTGEGVNNGNGTYQMFGSTGGTFKDTPEINTTYYTSNTVV